MFNNLKIAIIYDWIDKWGGVERILLTFHQMFPQADFYSSYFNKEGAPWAKNLKIKTSFIDKFPGFIKKNRIFSLPFYPYAFESFNFSNYHLVISVTSSFAKSVITKPKTIHVCYLLTPTRYLWLFPEFYFTNKWIKIFFSPYLDNLRRWDFIAAQRPDYIISISKTVANRCQKYYQRDSKVVYPPFDIQYWQKIKNQKLKIKNYNLKLKILENKKFFLLVSRLEPYKLVDLAIQSFNQLNNLLVVVGKGSQVKKLKKQAKKNIVFFKDLTDEEIGWLYQKAQALIIPQEEDFGYTSLEAQFFGCPIIAYKKGGSWETIVENKTGIFFEQQTVTSLLKVIKKFHIMSYNIKTKAMKFGLENIKKFAKEKFINEFYYLLKSRIKKNFNL